MNSSLVLRETHTIVKDDILLKEKLDFLIRKGDEKLLKILYAVAKEYVGINSDSNIENKVAPQQLYRLVYTSARSADCNDQEIEKILAASKVNNKPLGITGVLLHTHDRFLQVLEGEKDKVMSLYHKIEKDQRHGGSMMRYCEPVSERHFGDWNMAGKQMNSKKIKYDTSISAENKDIYKSMLNGDIHSYKDDGMRVLKTFIAFS